MDRSNLLAQITMLRGLPPDDRQAIGQRMTERPYAPGQLIFAKGERGSSMYVVGAGTVRVFLPPASEGAPRVVLKELHAGEHFGELALFDDKPRSASAEAETEAVLLELSRDDFIAGLVRSPTAVLSMLSEMANRLRDTNQLLSQRAAKDVVKEMEASLSWPQRLADRVAAINGSWAFILFLLGLSAVWSFSNVWLGQRAFDSYPFAFYNLFLAILVALQGPLIVMSQNRQAEKERAQAASDFQVNLKNEVNIEMLVRQVTDFRRETTERLDKLEGERARLKAG